MTILVHALDVETSRRRIGPGGLMSIGAVCVDSPKHRRGNGEVVRTFFGVIAWPDGLVRDDPYTNDFWSRNPEAYAASTTGGEPPETVAARLHAHIAEVQAMATARRAQYVLATDNAFFDPGWIDWFLATYGPKEALPLRYHSTGGYMANHQMVDVGQRFQVLNESGVSYPRFRPPRGDGDGLLHCPTDDALRIVRRYEHYRRIVADMRFSAGGATHY